MGTAGFEPTANKSGACRDTGLRLSLEAKRKLRHVPMAYIMI